MQPRVRLAPGATSWAVDGQAEQRPYVDARSLLDGIVGLVCGRHAKNGLMPLP